MGRHFVPGADAPHQVVTALAESALAAGDWAKLGSGGHVRRAADGVPLALQNAAAGVTALAASSPVEASGSAWGRSGFNAQVFRAVLALDNGNFAVVYSGNGTQVDTGVNLRIHNSMRVPVTPRLVVTTATGVIVTRLARAGTDNIIVAWAEGAAFKFAIYSVTTGASVVPETAVASLISSDVLTWAMASLANGDVVLAYGKASSNDFAFKRFNAAGVLQGTEVVVEAGASPSFIGVLPLAGGGFVLHYYRAAAATAYRFARFNATGVQQGALATLATGAAHRTVTPVERSAMELGNGNLVFVDPSSSSSAALRLYDAGGNFLATVLLATGVPNSVCICPRQFGGFWAAVGGQLLEFDNTGNCLRQSSLVGSAPFMLWDRPGTGPVMAVHLVGSGFTVNLYSWNAELSAIEGPLTLATSSSVLLSYAWVEMLSNGMLASVVCGQPSAGPAVVGVSIPQASSMLGIAQEPAVPGASVRVATAGKFISAQSFNGPAFDRRSATPPGTRGVAVGNTVVLGGLMG